MGRPATLFAATDVEPPVLPWIPQATPARPTAAARTATRAGRRRPRPPPGIIFARFLNPAGPNGPASPHPTEPYRSPRTQWPNWQVRGPPRRPISSVTMRAVRRFTVRAGLPESLAGLGELATNLRWTWHPPTRDLFASMDAELFDAVRDPLRMLTALPPARLAELAVDDDFLAHAKEATADLKRYLTEPRWYQRQDDPELPAAVAYFSMEFGVTEALPNYSGGLGVLAGDHLKAASDLGVPMIGVGLLYRNGYFRQSLSLDGWQVEHYPVIDPNAFPLELLTAGGRPVLIGVA